MTYIDNSAAYAAEVDKWTIKFLKLMIECNNASEAILAYYLPNQVDSFVCPQGNQELKQIGEELRINEAMFAAAEDSGLLSEAMDSFFEQALDSLESWHYLWPDVEYVLTNPRLCRYVRFEHQYSARTLLAVNHLISVNEEVWYTYQNALDRKLTDRNPRGF